MTARGNLLDRAIAYVSPAAGAKRMSLRVGMQAAASLSMAPGTLTGPSGFAAARGNNGIKGIRRRPKSANADYLGGQTSLIGQSAFAWMNMPLATAAVERPVEFTIGTGLMAIPEIDPASVGMTPEALAPIVQRIRTDYDEYMASKDPDAAQMSTGYVTQEINYRGTLVFGDMLVVRTMPEDQRGRVSTTSWRFYEAHWIVSPNGHVEGNVLTDGPYRGRVCIAGVAQDDHGAPIAFSVLKKDPGSFATRTADDIVWIPAWGDKSPLPTAFLVARLKRANETRGFPFLAPVLDIVQKVSTLSRAEAAAAVIASMVALTYKSPGAQPMPEPIFETGPRIVTGGMTADDLPASRDPIALEEGTVLELDSDSEIDVKSPGRPNPDFAPFFQELARQIGASRTVPLEVLLLHFESSYTASRAAIETLYQCLVDPTRAWFAGTCESIRYSCWLFEQVARGRYRLPGFLTDENKRAAWSRVRFRGDGKISMDPSREAKALEIHEAHGWATGAQITAELNGGDYDANITTRIAEHQRFVDGGLPIPNVVGGGNGVPEATDTTDNIAGSGSGGTGSGKQGN